MKVLIQETGSGEYINLSGARTPRANEADDFHSALRAYLAGKAQAIEKFVVVFFFPEISYSLVVMRGKGAARA